MTAPLRAHYLERFKAIHARLLRVAPDGCGIAWAQREIDRIEAGKPLRQDCQQWLADMEDHTARVERRAARATMRRWFHPGKLTGAFR